MRHNCAENASCMNLPGSFNCSCNQEYEGDQYVNCTGEWRCLRLPIHCQIPFLHQSVQFPISVCIPGEYSSFFFYLARVVLETQFLMLTFPVLNSCRTDCPGPFFFVFVFSVVHFCFRVMQGNFHGSLFFIPSPERLSLKVHSNPQHFASRPTVTLLDHFSSASNAISTIQCVTIKIPLS